MPIDEYAELRQTALMAAARAGEVIRKGYSQPQGVYHKGLRDLVTDTDRETNDRILALIEERHPDHHIFSEEDPANIPNADGTWTIPGGVVWIVDPLDGTTNFVNGVPFICVSIAAVVDGEPVVGAVFDALRHEFFVGSKGQGVTVNDQPLQPLKPAALADSVVAFGWSRQPDLRDHTIATVAEVMPRCMTGRTLGSAALTLAYVAAGRIGAYVHYGMKPWDVAAAAVMIREVGGDLRHPLHGEWSLSRNGAVSGHPSVLDEIQPHLRYPQG